MEAGWAKDTAIAVVNTIKSGPFATPTQARFGGETMAHPRFTHVRA